MDFNGLSFNGARWTAVLAPIGIMSDDGRTLAPEYRLDAAAFPLPLRRDLPGDPIIGTVDLAGVDGGHVVAGGTVVDASAAMGMELGQLRPQMHLDTLAFNDDGSVAGGTLRMVTASESLMVWSGCRFTITGPL